MNQSDFVEYKQSIQTFIGAKMRLKSVKIQNGFKRFSSLSIEDLSETARLVVMTGPNGSGKSSLFDAFRTWQTDRGLGGSRDGLYYGRSDISPSNFTSKISFEFFGSEPSNSRKAFYIRSAYRHEPDFTVQQIRNMGTIIDGKRIERLITNGAS
ncbi:MAG: AAA family ATPase [Chloroflexota bacterium]